jgi:putative DNA primase/helicase
MGMHLRLDPSAYQEWKEFQRRIELQFRDGGQLQGLKDWGTKLPGAALRVAGGFHFVEHSQSGDFDAEVCESTMTRAIEFAVSLISHARAVFALMERDPAIEGAQKLLAWIVREGRASFTMRECFRAHQSRFKRLDALVPVLLLLEEHGYIRRTRQESTGGRKPSDVCDVNPALFPAGGLRR